MNFRRVYALLCVAIVAWSTQARAQAPASSADVAELIRRLEQAEAKIRSLEGQLQKQHAPQHAPEAIESISDEKVAPKSSLDDRLAELEKAYKADKEAAKEKDKPKNPSLKLGGRIHLDYWGHPTSDPGINALERGDPTLTPQERITFRRLRLFASGTIRDNMVYKFETEFADPNDFEFRDAYIGFTELPYLQTVLVGNQKRPLGLDHWNSSRYNIFIERPLVIESFNEDARRLGITSYGVNDAESVNWQFGVYNLERVQDDGDYRDDHLQLSANGRISSTPWYDEASGGRGYLHLGIAGMVAHTDGDSRNTGTTFNQARFRTRPSARTSSRWLDTGRIAEAEYYEVLGLEALLNIGAFSLTSEFQNTFVQRDIGEDLYFHGGYVQAAYWLTGEHTPIDRKKGALGRTKPFENFFLVNRCCGGAGGGWGAWQVAVRTQYLDLSDDNILGGEGYGATFALNWWWNDHARLQLNYLIGRVTDSAQLADGTTTGGDYSIIGARMMVDF